MSESEIIYSYTRQQAIEDGVLADVSQLAKEAGIKFPVAVTETLYNIISNLEAPGQDLTGRTWDVVWLLRNAMLKAEGGTDTVYFTVYFQEKSGNNKYFARPRKLWAKVGPGDNREPVITVMLEGED